MANPQRPLIFLNALAVTLWLLAPACSPLQANPAEPTPATDQPPACLTAGQSWVSPVDGASLVCVPAGEFLRGAAPTDPQAGADEQPQHRVYLDPFWIDRTEVTNGAYARCIAAGGCQPRTQSPYLEGVFSRTRPDYYQNPAYAAYPVILYNAEAAQVYCRWAGRRLPTEAEWEKAARGEDGRLYPWGDEVPDCAKASYGACTRDTVPADSHPAGTSPYGALNMAGNVWEWVADWYAPDYYAQAPARNPTGPAAGEFRVRRGGGWHGLTKDLRATTRVSGNPHHYFDGQMGFRCAVGPAGL